MRRFLPIAALAALALAGVASAQIVPSTTYTHNLPATCDTSKSRCTLATPVVNPDGTNIGGGGGSSDITSVIPGTSATNLGKAEDNVAANSDTGVMALAVVKSNPSTGLGADGDYAPLALDSSGRLQVSTGGGSLTTIANGGTASGTTDSGNPVKIGCVYNATPPTVTTGQRVDCQAGPKGSIATHKVNPADGVTLSIVNGSADDLSTANTGDMVYSRVFDGTGMDRVRDVTSASATTGAGIPAAGMMGRYNAALPNLTEAQFGSAQLTSKGGIVTSLFSTGGTAVLVSSPAATGNTVGAALTTNNQNLVYNGSTWDAVRSVDAGYNSAVGNLPAVTLGQVDDVSTTTVSENNFGAVRQTAQRALLVNASGGYPVVTPAAVTSAVDLFSTDVSQAASIGVQVISPGTSSTISYEGTVDGTNWTTVAGVFTNPGGGAPTATSTTAGAMRFSTQGLKSFRARVSTFGSGSVQVAYQLSGLPVSTNGQAVYVANGNIVVNGGPYSQGASGTGGSPVTVGGLDGGGLARRLLTDTAGALATYNVAPSTAWSYAPASGGIVNTTTAVTVKTAVASVRNCVASLQVAADTLGAATELAIRDGAAGTVLWRTKIQTAGLNATSFTLPAPVCGTVNTLLEVVTLTATTTGGVYVNVQGMTQP